MARQRERHPPNRTTRLLPQQRQASNHGPTMERPRQTKAAGTTTANVQRRKEELVETELGGRYVPTNAAARKSNK